MAYSHRPVHVGKASPAQPITLFTTSSVILPTANQVTHALISKRLDSMMNSSIDGVESNLDPDPQAIEPSHKSIYILVVPIAVSECNPFPLPQSFIIFQSSKMKRSTIIIAALLSCFTAASPDDEACAQNTITVTQVITSTLGGENAAQGTVTVTVGGYQATLIPPVTVSQIITGNIGSDNAGGANQAPDTVDGNQAPAAPSVVPAIQSQSAAAATSSNPVTDGGAIDSAAPLSIALSSTADAVADPSVASPPMFEDSAATTTAVDAPSAQTGSSSTQSDVLVDDTTYDPNESTQDDSSPMTVTQVVTSRM